jgi:uncharacterized protein YgiM (DUF1202 family)
MERKTKNTIAITILSVVALAGIGLFIYDKIKIKKLNAQLSTPEEMENIIEENLSDIPDGPIEDTPVNPNFTASIEYDDYGNPIDSNISEDLVNDVLIVYAKSGARLRSQPNTNSTILGTFQEGDVFFVIDSSQQNDGLWYNVDDTTGNIGWFRNDVVTTI